MGSAEGGQEVERTTCWGGQEGQVNEQSLHIKKGGVDSWHIEKGG